MKVARLHATDNSAENGVSPKAEALHRLGPAAFVDDYLSYLVGIAPDNHELELVDFPVTVAVDSGGFTIDAFAEAMR